MTLNPLALFRKRLTPKQLFVLVELSDKLRDGPVKESWDMRFTRSLSDLAILHYVEYGRNGFRLTETGKRAVEEREGK